MVKTLNQDGIEFDIEVDFDAMCLYITGENDYEIFGFIVTYPAIADGLYLTAVPVALRDLVYALKHEANQQREVRSCLIH